MRKIFANSIHFKKTDYLLALISMIILMCSITSCNKEKDKGIQEQTLKGPEVTMGNGKANNIFKIDGNGAPLEIGFEMTMEALVGLTQTPMDFANSTFVLEINQEALELTPFDHLVINWQPHGHPPMNVFTTPHFDFHFYTITLAEQMAIAPYSPATAAKFDLLPPAGFMPVSYRSDPGGIPAMGKHWIDSTTITPFSHTMVYVSYNEQVNFIEPMVTLDVLQAGTRINTTYAQPQNFAKTGKWYPTKYNIYMDGTHKHFVTLSEFVKR